MRLLFLFLMFLGPLELCVAVGKNKLRWCMLPEDYSKCRQLSKSGTSIICSRKTTHLKCFEAIENRKADFMILDSTLMFEAVKNNYMLKPLVAEFYGPLEQPRKHYYSVALVKKSSRFQINQLKGVKSCHSSHNDFSGWIGPLTFLRPFLNWTGPPESLEKAVSNFFSASCVPCVDKDVYPILCARCAGRGPKKCACSKKEPYFGFSGAFKCLRDGDGEVAFVRDSTVFEEINNESDKNEYELLCPDNTRKPVEKFEKCNLGKIPSLAMIIRSAGARKELIWNLLNQAQETNYDYGDSSHLFKFFSLKRNWKGLLFSKAATGFVQVPSKVDMGMYIGPSLPNVIMNLKLNPSDAAKLHNQVRWCTVGPEEKNKCQQWSIASGGNVTCTFASSKEQCILLLQKGNTDALTLDGELIYTAGKCGLVPVLEENQNPEGHIDCANTEAEAHFAVAVIRKSGPEITWDKLKTKKSCHSAMGRNAGWKIPMGLISNHTDSCNFDKFFSESCVPGANPRSSLCHLCIGNEDGMNKCSVTKERYYDDKGAFRCLAENAGDIAFVTSETVLKNTDGKGTDAWAEKLMADDFELLCLDGSRMPVTDADMCHMAKIPNHAVVSHKDKVQVLEKLLIQQQNRFGIDAVDCPEKFCMFQSQSKNLLFSDKTECLSKLQGRNTYETYLGLEFSAAIAALNKCSSSGILEACEFISL